MFPVLSQRHHFRTRTKQYVCQTVTPLRSPGSGRIASSRKAGSTDPRPSHRASMLAPEVRVFLAPHGDPSPSGEGPNGPRSEIGTGRAEKRDTIRRPLGRVVPTSPTRPFFRATPRKNRVKPNHSRAAPFEGRNPGTQRAPPSFPILLVCQGPVDRGRIP